MKSRSHQGARGGKNLMGETGPPSDRQHDWSALYEFFVAP
jgi:hypothetical protein